ncbi:hypothetical protein AVEN_130523-1 [Araneus ventricosus]|uniref:Uncharacterized protein n=1 Tax=Araneus ventricosus TaxID=182803 RepID=A0A4Y2EJ48_ARAVE|nr:hypothetical protein AVEN_130523-1 [Araneus ventricosus]
MLLLFRPIIIRFDFKKWHEHRSVFFSIAPSSSGSRGIWTPPAVPPLFRNPDTVSVHKHHHYYLQNYKNNTFEKKFIYICKAGLFYTLSFNLTSFIFVKLEICNGFFIRFLMCWSLKFSAKTPSAAMARS